MYFKGLNFMNFLGKHKSNLDTPCLIIDRKKLLANIQSLQKQANIAGKQVRPHVKTHKCISIARMQIEAGAIGMSAVKVSEAFILAQHGFRNTLITSPVVTPFKIENLIECLKLDPQLTVVLDNIQNAQLLNDAAKEAGLVLTVLIDVDPGTARTGIAYHETLEFAKALAPFSHLKLAGIQCYAGNLQHIIDDNERSNASKTVMQKAAKCLNQLKEAGFHCEILSGSGTGTYDIDFTIAEVTEVQPGSYTVMDAEYRTLATKKKTFEPAMTLLTTVTSVNHANHVTCDAGWKSLYVTPAHPVVISGQYEYAWFGDEHGKISPKNNARLPKLGEQLELIVSHCDPTINMYDYFYIIENDIVIDKWPIEMRGS